MNKIGWGLVIVGAVLQMTESTAKASALLNGTQFSATTIGAIVAPIEQYTPIQLGWLLLTLGGGILIYTKAG